MELRKTINVLTLIVMMSVNVFTPFSYADVESGDLVDIEQPTVEEPVVEQLVAEELLGETPEKSDDSDFMSGSIIDIEVPEEGEKSIEVAEPVLPVVESGDVISMSGENDDVDDEHGITELSGGDNNVVENGYITQEEGILIDSTNSLDGLLNIKYEEDQLETFDVDISNITYGNQLYTVSIPLTGNGGDDRNNFSYMTITIGTGDDAIVIMDRNLGATSVWNTGDVTWDTDDSYTDDQIPGSYGYYYQWGNNFGFAPNMSIYNTTGTRVDVSGFGPDNPYISSTWVKTYPWQNSNSNGYNLRGNTDANSDITKQYLRQGPCPEGWHVPSRYEWSDLDSVMRQISSEGKVLAEILRLPPAGGLHYYYLNVDYAGRNGYYWSSTPNNQDSSFYLQFYPNSSFLTNSAFTRSFGYSVRCFKNEYDEYVEPLQPITVTYDANGGYFSGGSITQQHTYNYSGSDIIPIYNIQIPNRVSDNPSQQSGWMFDGWYTTAENQTEEFDISNPQTTTAYAKWLPFNDLTVTLGDETFTIMDRNLGAKGTALGIRYENYNGSKYESLDLLGKYYQWGNNYGFKNDGQVDHWAVNERVGGDEYGPYNYFYNNKFIDNGDQPYGWSTTNNINYRGGNNPLNEDSDKKGPCPEGYHIPEIYEWKYMSDIFTNWKNGEGKDYCSGLKINECFTKLFKIPFAGSSYQTGYAIGRGAYGNYWSSTYSPYNEYQYAYYMQLINRGMEIHDNSREVGYSIRCFKNSEGNNILSIDKDNGESNNLFKLRWWEPTLFYKQENPINFGYDFLGRYYFENNRFGDRFPFSNSNFINGITNVKAKWRKNPWYTFYYDSGSIEVIKSNVSGTIMNDDGITINSPSENVPRKYVFRFTGEDALHVSITNWNRSCTNKTLIYDYDRENVNEDYLPYAVIEQECGAERNGCKTNYDYVIKNDVVTVETIGSSCPSDSFDVQVYSLKNNYVLDGINNSPNKLGYTFSGRYESGELKPFNFTGTPVTQDRIFYAKWNPHHYTIHFNINEGTGVANDINATYGEEINLPVVTREGYAFEGWLSEDGTIYTNSIPEGTGVTTEDGVIVKLTANWEKIEEKGSGGNNSYSGGGKKWPSNNTQHNASIEEAEIETIKVIDNQYNDNKDSNKVIDNELNDNVTNNNNYTQEQKESYSFAKSNGITTTSSIKEAKMNTSLKRIEMAKMLSYYAINVLGQEPDTSKGIVKFNDVSNKMDKQYDNGVTLSYQLGIMGQNMPKNKFRPNDEVTRAEFVTALSRMIYNTQDGKGNVKYYEPHMAKLYNEGIISNTNPKMKEKRGYVMTMLMRSASK